MSTNGVGHFLTPSPAPSQPSTMPSLAPSGLTTSALNFINSSPPNSALENGITSSQTPSISSTTLDYSVAPTSHNTLIPESMLTFSSMYSGVTTNAQVSHPAWSPASGLSQLFDVRGKGDLPVYPSLLAGLPGGESLLLGNSSPEHDMEASSPLGSSDEIDGESKILTQLQSVPVDDDLGL